MSTAPLTVVVADHNIARRRELLAEGSPSGTRFTVFDEFDETAVTAALPGADALIASTFTARMGAAAGRLRLVHTGGIGTDRVDGSALPAGAVLASTGHHGRSIAEYAVMSAIYLLRRIGPADAGLRRGRWVSAAYDFSLPPAPTLRDKTIGLVGFGEIGTQTWQLARAFGMRGVAITSGRPVRDGGEGLAWTGGPGDLGRLLAESDVVVLSLPLTPATTGLLGRDRVGQMRPGAILVNVARGPVADEDALFDALSAGTIGGAALDVWYSYPRGGDLAQPSRLPFAALDNVLMTPHLSGVTEETFSFRVRDICVNLTRLANREPLQNVVATGGAR
jgi:phosphoglycerate dehydrogenase-like enzyme